MFSSLISMFNEVLTLSRRSDRNTSISEARLSSRCLRGRIELKATRIAKEKEVCDTGWRTWLNQHEFRKIFIKSVFLLLRCAFHQKILLFVSVLNGSSCYIRSVAWRRPLVELNRNIASTNG